MNFEASAVRGRYFVTGTFPSGRAMKIRVQKEQVMNPSVRGGAYKTVWLAKFSTHRATGDTRAEAVAGVVRLMAARGLKITF